MKNKPICIIGGMGPQASAYLYNLLIKKAVSDYGIKKDENFPEIIIYSIAVPDFISDKKQRKETLELVQKRVREINKLKISSLSIACNTAHLLIPELEMISKISFTSMIGAVVKKIKIDNKKIVGLMGTPTTLKSRLYEDPLAKSNIKTVIPSGSEIVELESVIRRIIAGSNSTKDSKTLLKIASNLKRKGAEGIILGCTELPIVFPQNIGVKLFNSLEILADRLLLDYYYK